MQNRRGVPSSRRGGARGGEHLCPLGWVPALGTAQGLAWWLTGIHNWPGILLLVSPPSLLRGQQPAVPPPPGLDPRPLMPFSRL